MRASESNTEPDPHTDLRQTLRAVLIETCFRAYAKKGSSAWAGKK